MATCIACGKRIGMFESSEKLCASDPNVFCTTCYQLLSEDTKILSNKDSSSTDIENAEKHMVETATEHGFSAESIQGIESYIRIMENSREIMLHGMKPQEELERKRKQELARQQAILNALTPEDLDNHLMTTGYTLEGYRITSYVKVISGSTVLGTSLFSEWSANISDLFGEESNSFSAKLEEARATALKKLIQRSILLGGNAIIGVDFDYMTLSGNMIGVIANGTCVKAEKLPLE